MMGEAIVVLIGLSALFAGIVRLFFLALGGA